MQVVVYQEFGKSVSVLTHYGSKDLVANGVEKVPLGCSFWVIDTTELPQSREYRDAWELNIDELGAPSGVGART